MNQEQAQSLGHLLRQRRHELGLSTRQLGTLTNMRDSSIVRIEQGLFAAPRPDKLSRIAVALHLSRSDIYARAGYFAPDELPGIEAYLRAKYPELPDTALTELLEHFKQVQERHGLHLDPTDPEIERLQDEPAGGTS